MKKLIFLTAALPLPLNAALIEMWTFNDVPVGNAPSGTTSIGINGRVATVLGAGATSDATGGPGVRGINLPGGGSGAAAYIDLPNGLASARTDMTLETWVTVSSLQAWSRIFDFGATNVGSGPQGGELFGPGGGGEGTEYIMISAMNGTDNLHQRLENRENQITTNTTDGAANNTLGVQHLWTFVWDDLGNGTSTQAYYMDGVLYAQSAPFASNLAQLNDVNNWLGRSNWTGDANTDGTYDQFSVYDTAFNSAEAAAGFARGPVPEPSGTLVLAGSLLGLISRRRRA
ncbi:MAG TPA: LamG-like jellyroll fold domain-containing protein [Verrucomicrobiales bacterium]|nr:LamG-like jellyroll fold domain-containing protein [Verrucomicrobiales bacterium]